MNHRLLRTEVLAIPTVTSCGPAEALASALPMPAVDFPAALDTWSHLLPSGLWLPQPDPRKQPLPLAAVPLAIIAKHAERVEDVLKGPSMSDADYGQYYGYSLQPSVSRVLAVSNLMQMSQV